MKKTIPTMHEYYCDRCSKKLNSISDFWVDGGASVRKEGFISGEMHKTIELCRGCANDFHEFMGWAG